MKLTDEQIAELAPDWATHYSHNATTLTFSNTEKAVVTDFKGVYQCSEHDNEVGFKDEDKPIQRKKFDISEYEFSDERIGFLQDDKGLLVEIEGDFYEVAYINKNDSIALAKHFKLTAEDLR